MNVAFRLISFPLTRSTSVRNLLVLCSVFIAEHSAYSADSIDAAAINAAANDASANRPSYSVDDFSKILLIQPTATAAHNPLIAERRDVVRTGLGNVAIRWPSRLTSQLSFSPGAVIQSAWKAAARVLVERGFPEDLAGESYDWNVVVSGDGAALVPSVNRVSSSYCHTALMGPPADIVIDGYRLLHPCAAGVSAEQALVISLVHEVGHAVEYRLLDTGFSRRQRWHGEGFATWFETQARERLSFRAMTSDDRTRLRERARSALAANWRPYLFQGSPEDYARSYGLVATIAEVHSVPALVRVYKRMAEDNCLFEDAVERELGLSFDQWLVEARKFLEG